MNFRIASLFLFIGTALSTQPPPGKHLDSLLFWGLLPYPLEVGSDRILDDLWFINVQWCQSDSKGRVMVLKQSFQKGKTKDLITMFALNVLDVADGKVAFCSFSFVWEIKYKEMICGRFFSKTKSLVSCEKFLSLWEKNLFLSFNLWKGRQDGRRGHFYSLNDFVVSFLLFLYLQPTWLLSVQKDFKESFVNIIA